MLTRCITLHIRVQKAFEAAIALHKVDGLRQTVAVAIGQHQRETGHIEQFLTVVIMHHQLDMLSVSRVDER